MPYGKYIKRRIKCTNKIENVKNTFFFQKCGALQTSQLFVKFTKLPTQNYQTRLGLENSYEFMNYKKKK